MNGIISVPIMAVLMLMAARSDVMGRLLIHRRLKVLGWLCTVVMAVAVIAMFVAGYPWTSIGLQIPPITATVDR